MIQGCYVEIALQELKKHKVRDVVRVCEPSYMIEELQNEGINVTDLEFDDGTPPPVQVCEHDYFGILDNHHNKLEFDTVHVILN